MHHARNILNELCAFIYIYTHIYIITHTHTHTEANATLCILCEKQIGTAVLKCLKDTIKPEPCGMSVL